MAQSRLERIGTIYSRTTSLLRGGAMKKEDTPLWYVIYEAFPPKVEPRYDRPIPTTPIRPILYKEDLIRAKFQKNNAKLLASSLVNTKTKSRTQKFISIYEELEKSGVAEEELYTKAMETYHAQMEIPRVEIAETVVEKKNTAATRQELNVDLTKIFTP